jgi:hypothetical protein
MNKTDQHSEAPRADAGDGTGGDRHHQHEEKAALNGRHACALSGLES